MVAKAIASLHKAREFITSRRLHRHAFRYCLAAHLIHVTAAAPEVNTLEAAISFGAALGTLLIHVTEESEADKEERIRMIALEAAKATKAAAA